jgi:hypothetical protein
MSPLKNGPQLEVGVASREVVERNRQETRRRERLAGVAADEAGTAGDENGLHAVPSYEFLVLDV